ncbi:MAG: SMP-30/gluconolactonase/LRE family protein [Candidatus Binatia bacterium]
MADTVDAAPRRRGLRAVLVMVLLLALLAGGFTLRVLWLGGAFTRIHPHFAGRCRLVEGPVGPEDLTIDAPARRAIVSATDRRAAQAGSPKPGGIWSYPLDPAGAAPVNLTPDASVYLQPHGISLWREPDGRAALFVVNHPAPGHGWPAHTVEIYDLAGDALSHRATLTDPRLVMPNDLVAVGLDRFYVTNTHAHGPGRLQALETYLQLRGAEVLHYGPGGFTTAIPGLVFPNGINVSPDGRTVYVAAVTWRSVLMYDRDPVSDALTHRRDVPIGSGGDNIEVDGDGQLWIGSHPKLLAVPRHAENAANPAPAQVLRVSADGERVDEIYLGDGRPIAAASAAARLGNRLLIGQIFGNGFLDCEMAQ